MGKKRTNRTQQQPKENARLSEERFRIIWERSFDGMRLIDESGRIVMVNDAYCRQVDKPREELEGRLLDEVYAQPAGRRILQMTVERIQKQSVHPHFERLVTLWNGNKVWFELSNSFIDLDTGQHFLLSIFRDITDRKRAEEELRNNQDYLQSIFRAAPAGIGVVVNRVIVRANQQLCGMTGYSERELVNQSARMLYPGDEGYEYVGREKYRQIQEQGTGTVETRWRCKNGKIIDVLLSSTPIDWNDHSKGITFTALDITVRKQYENALHESERRFREILDCSQDVIYRQKFADGRFDYISPAVNRMFGYSPEEIQQMSPENIQGLFHPDDIQKLMPFRFELEQADRSGKKLSEREFRLMNRSGEHRWIHGQYELIRNADGAPEYIVGTLHDITERKRAEGALWESEERFRGILQNVATVAVQGYTLDGIVRYWNRASESFYGYTAAEALGRNLLDLIIPPAMRDEVRGAIRHMAETGKPIPSAELALMRKDGSRIPVYSSHALVTVPGQASELFCIDIDLSARQQTEAALRSSEALYHDLVETSQDLIWQCDAQGRYTYLNPAWEQVFGYRIDEMLGRSFAEFQSPEQSRRDLELFGRILLTERIVKGYETIHLRKDGTELHLVFNAKVLFDANNQVSGTRGTAYDITERKRAVEEERRTQARRQRELEVVAAVALSPNLVEGDLRELAVELTESAARALEVERVSVWLFEEDETKLVCLDLFQASARAHSSEMVLHESDFQSEFDALKTGKYVAAHDPMTDPRTVGYVTDYLKPNRITSMLDAVIRAGGRNLGLICFEHVDRPHHWTNDEINCACQLADQVALAVTHRERKRAEDALRQSEARYRVLVDNAPEAIYVRRGETFAYVNPAAVRLFGAETADQLLGTPVIDRFATEIRETVRERIRILNDERKPVPHVEHDCVRLDGSVITVNASAVPVDYEGERASITFMHDITDRKRAVEAIKESEEKFRVLAENAPGVIYLCNNDERWTMVYLSDAVKKLTGYSKEEFLSDRISFRDLYHPDDMEYVYRTVDTALRNNEAFRIEYRIFDKNKSCRWIEERGVRIGSTGKSELIEGFLSDITESKRAEEEKERLQSQLTQAQKMESVGRLAGGVAHDFNNMLGAILGYSELALKSSDPSLLPNYLQKIQKAAERSADLTRQLLAFARKQTVAPKVLNLNGTVEPMLDMIRRLIGEDIELVWQPGENLGSVFMDPSQVDQILANLCVNARDAIAGTGKITIATKDAVLDEEFCSRHAGFVPGEYVLLSVSDDGSGMDAETLTHLFEPFFTTKHLGKGTGLGLATVYGAVSQNNGFIDVTSRLGEGTTFAVYLPRHAGKTLQDEPDVSTDQVNKGQETILLVEDESAILDISVEMLEASGYLILAAKTPGEAIQKAREFPGRIHLLITDVIMPEMNGRELAKNILTLYPNLRCLFISGYTADIIAHHGVLEPGVHFLQKPFTTNGLAKKVREALDGE